MIPSFIRSPIPGTTRRHCMDVQSYDAMTGDVMGYVFIDTDTMEPVQYGPEVCPDIFLDMDPIQECDGCMAGYHPGLLTVRESGSLMCAECCAVEDGD